MSRKDFAVVLILLINYVEIIDNISLTDLKLHKNRTNDIQNTVFLLHGKVPCRSYF